MGIEFAINNNTIVVEIIHLPKFFSCSLITYPILVGFSSDANIKWMDKVYGGVGYAQLMLPAL